MQTDTSPAFPDPQTHYQGQDLGYFTSGLPEGDYYFRIRTIDSSGQASSWSKTLTLTVEYPAEKQVWTLLLLGTLLFVILIYIVISGHRSYYGSWHWGGSTS